MLKQLVVMGFVCWSIDAFAGHIDGNGTGGLFNSDTESVTMYDIWEGENQKFLLGQGPNLKFSWSGNPMMRTRHVMDRIQSVAPRFGQKIEECFYKLRSESRFLPQGMQFSPPADIDPTFLPEGSVLVRVAAMDDEEHIWIDRERFDVMNQYQKEALFLHETVYLIQRVAMSIYSTSLPTRKLIACAYAENCSEIELGERAGNFEYEFIDPNFYLTCD